MAIRKCDKLGLRAFYPQNFSIPIPRERSNEVFILGGWGLSKVTKENCSYFSRKSRKKRWLRGVKNSPKFDDFICERTPSQTVCHISGAHNISMIVLQAFILACWNKERLRAATRRLAMIIVDGIGLDNRHVQTF